MANKYFSIRDTNEITHTAKELAQCAAVVNALNTYDCYDMARRFYRNAQRHIDKLNELREKMDRTMAKVESGDLHIPECEIG